MQDTNRDSNQLLNQAQQAELQGNNHEALQIYQQLLLLHPTELGLHARCGNLCAQLARFEEAAGYFRRLLQANKKSDDTRNALCYCLAALGNQAHSNSNYLQAEACFEEVIQHQPGNAAYWYNLGNAQRELGKPQAALESLRLSIKFDPNDADAHNNLGNVQRELGRLDAAIASYERALQINPNLHHALAHLVHQKQHICDWTDLDVQITEIRRLVREEPSAQISPFAFLALSGATASEQKQCASNWANNLFGHMIENSAQTAPNKTKNAKEKINIGYLSADFRLHPLAFLITELIEKHDRNKFKVVAYSYGAVDNTPTRKRLVKAFDQFNDIRSLNDIQAVQKIQQDDIDILVDLTGFTQTSRTGIVALKPAPISINWLGYAGTMGYLNNKPLFDYIFADHIIAPNPDDFSEQLLYLPCYQPNDSQRPIGKNTTKVENNLPADVFVFCCFNQTFKITAAIFSAWMRILEHAPNSVLWLLDCNPWAKSNLQREAENAGVAAERIIFAPRVPITEHLARHVHANLFLDTLPYNAHTTASDALFMGVPVLTILGNTLASRVAASLLTRAGLPELIANNLQDYEQKAVFFAQHPEKLNELNLANKKSPLFDASQFARDIEQQYLNIWGKLDISTKLP
jgi:predicted O-linked N-acetylglucosamine transferase (SPINDLY family)